MPKAVAGKEKSPKKNSKKGLKWICGRKRTRLKEDQTG